MTTIPRHGKPRQTSPDTPESRARRKALLVDLGLELLALGERDAVQALTTIIRERRLSHD